MSKVNALMDIKKQAEKEAAEYHRNPGQVKRLIVIGSLGSLAFAAKVLYLSMSAEVSRDIMELRRRVIIDNPKGV